MVPAAAAMGFSMYGGFFFFRLILVIKLTLIFFTEQRFINVFVKIRNLTLRLVMLVFRLPKCYKYSVLGPPRRN